MRDAAAYKRVRMAERFNVAFGRYLRMLRERKGYSLDDVAVVTKAYADPIGKGYLSRVEHGQVKFGFSKAITLARAYEVPLEVIAERHSLDLELKQMGGGPETKGKSLKELRELGRKARERGRRWETYAYLRDSLSIALDDELIPGYIDKREQHLATIIGVAGFAGALGRREFAVHELRTVERLGGLGREQEAMLYVHLGTSLWMLGRLDEAAAAADRGVSLSSDPPSRFLASALSCRASVRIRLGDGNGAIEDLKRGFRVNKDYGDVHG